MWILWALGAAGGVNSHASLLEYRLQAVAGSGPTETFQWHDSAKTVELETRPFLTLSDFQNAKVIPAGTNTPGKFSVEIFHTKTGARKFRETADKDRNRLFSIVFDGKIVQSYSFPPEQMKVHDTDNTIYGPFSHNDAMTIVHRIQEAIGKSRRH